MDMQRSRWRAAQSMRVLVAANTALVTYLVAAALIDGGGWQDIGRDLQAGGAILWLVVLVGWVPRRLRRALPV